MTTRVPAVLYARVSSKDQDKEGFSIPAQQKLLHSYAEEQGYHIEEEFIDVETAKRAGRTAFGKMVAYLKKHKACTVVLVEKTDRLYRNLKDWVELDAMDLQIHLVKENVILSEGSRSHEKFIHGIKVLMAKNYIDNLSEETRKGMLEKAEQGIWPGAAPLGYRNVARADGKRIIDVDPDNGPLVTRLFETYANGSISIADLAKAAQGWGLRNPKTGKGVPTPTIHYTLTNLLYTGAFVWNGRIYAGTHPALVSRELWDRVQERLEDRCTFAAREHKHNFLFSGFVRCGVCAELGDQGERQLIGELQRGRYIYYHCDGCRKAKRAAYIRQERLDEAMVKALRSLRLDAEVVTWVKNALVESASDERRFHTEAIARLHKQYENLQRRIDTAYDDRLDGRITVEHFERKADEWRAEQKRARQEIERHERANESYMAEGLALLELAGRAVDLYEAQPPEERRKLLEFVVLNTTWKSGNLEVAWRKPFDLLAESATATRKSETPLGVAEGGRLGWLPLPDLNRGPTD